MSHETERWSQYNRVCIDRDDAIARAEKAEARVQTLTTLAEKVDAIRNDIVGRQGFHFSEHGYPLVAALQEAGYPGVGYEIAVQNLGTLIEQTKAAEERDALGFQLDALRKRLALAEEVVRAARAYALHFGRSASLGICMAIAAYDAAPGDEKDGGA